MPGIREISKRSGVKSKDIEKVFRAITVLVGEMDEGAQAIKVQNFGSFYKHKLKGATIQRSFVNGGEPVQFDDTYIIKFSQARQAKNRVNEVSTVVERAAAKRAKTLSSPVKQKLPPDEEGATAEGAVGVPKKKR